MARWLVYLNRSFEGLPEVPQAVRVRDDCEMVYVPGLEQGVPQDGVSWVCGALPDDPDAPGEPRFEWASLVEAATEADALLPQAPIVGRAVYQYFGKRMTNSPAQPRP